MRILVFEFMVGGGVADQHPLSDELQTFYQQGHSMLKAVCEDLQSLGHQVVVPVDEDAEVSLPRDVIRTYVRCEREMRPVLYGAAAVVDRILLIAPESGGQLEHFAELLSNFSDQFISPDIEFIRLTADKWKCHTWFSQRNVPCPDTILLTADESNLGPEDFFPCVAKPVDGAGSEGVRLVSSLDELRQVTEPTILQQFVDGVPVSVSVIAESADKIHFLEPGLQVFDAEPFGIHLRTEYPLEPEFRERALKLAKCVFDACPDFTGYIGIDMILADEPEDDVLIEVNPRLTTSYCFLRQWSKQNLAQKFPL